PCQLFVPYSVFALMVGIAIGVGALFNVWQPVRSGGDYAMDQLSVFYHPFVIFSTAFFIDVHAFLKSLPQILIIAVPAATFAACFCGLLMKNLVNADWPDIDGVLFGTILMSIYPSETLRFYRRLGTTQFREISTLLEGESIIGTVFAVSMFEVIAEHLKGFIVYWYHFVLGILRWFVLGVPLGYLLGKCGSFLMRMSYRHHLTLSCLTVAMCYSSYYFGEVVAGAGSLVVMITGLIMGIERTTLPGDIEKFIYDTWIILRIIVNSILYINMGVYVPFFLSKDISAEDYLSVLPTYFLSNLGRLFSFLIFLPLLRKIGYGMSIRNMLLYIWMGIKNPIILNLAVDIDLVYPGDEPKARKIFLHTIFVYLLYRFIHIIFFPKILTLLKMTEISDQRRINMNNCMKIIMQARERAIAILRMDRFLSDANWPLVLETTSLKHPYKTATAGQDEAEEDEEKYLFANRLSPCPDCKKKLPVEPTNKELREMTREAKMRVLKLKKIYYSRLHENGMMSKEGLHNLHHTIEAAMETEQALVELDGILKLFNKELFTIRETTYSKIVKYFDRKIDKHRAMAYELGKNYLTGEEEILENLIFIIDHEKIRESLRQKFEEDRLSLTKVLGLAQIDRPRVAISVKTKLVMKSVLTSMKEDIYELKSSGWVDKIEFERLLASLSARYNYVKSIKFIPPSPPKLIFMEIPWMGDDEKLLNFLYDNVTTKKFDKAEIVCGEGEFTDGIYVLITGLLKVTYEMKKSVMDLLKGIGALPVVDYLSIIKFDESYSDYIVTGNTIGELCMLTQRPYNCTITAETHSQVYVIRREILKQAMEMDPNPVTGLECRIWKIVSFRVAIPLLTCVPAYRNFTQEQIKRTLERSFMPNLTNYKIFVVNEMMEDILLIEGVAVDYNTRDVFIGPYYIPRSVQRLILPKSSALNIDTMIETRLLLIPAKEFNELDIMLEEEIMGELIN
ncbi:Na H Exchanger and/or cNMP binding domain containing protein, partial [Asbolus verrucosus]